MCLAYLRTSECGLIFAEPSHLQFKRSVAALGALTVLCNMPSTQHHFLTNGELQQLALHPLGATSVMPDEDVAPLCMRLLDTLLFSEDLQCVFFAASKIMDYVQRSLTIQYIAAQPHPRNQASSSLSRGTSRSLSRSRSSSESPQCMSLERTASLRPGTCLSREFSMSTLRSFEPERLDATSAYWRTVLTDHR